MIKVNDKEGTPVLIGVVSVYHINDTVKATYGVRDYDDFIDEKYKNNENRLDIFEFLWENIELEVPIKLTNVNDYSNYQGKDWQLISEEDIDL